MNRRALAGLGIVVFSLSFGTALANAQMSFGPAPSQAVVSPFGGVPTQDVAPASSRLNSRQDACAADVTSRSTRLNSRQDACGADATSPSSRPNSRQDACATTTTGCYSPFAPPWASPVPSADSPGQNTATPPSPDTEQTEGRQVSWKGFIPNVLEDQKQIWLFPKNWFERKDLVPTAAFVAGTTGLVVLDPYTTPYFRRTNSFNEFNRIVSSRNSVIGMAAVPLSAYAVGLVRHDSYMEQTALLAGEAVVDSEVLTQVLKGTSRRLLPSYIPPYGNYRNTWFRNHTGPWYTAPGSFPSGHMIAATCIATVFARRYGRNRRWVPWVAYGLAGVVGFSRVTLSAHFPSDVFAAAFLGYAISRYDVLRGQ